jgi:hypothetical protein
MSNPAAYAISVQSLPADREAATTPLCRICPVHVGRRSASPYRRVTRCVVRRMLHRVRQNKDEPDNNEGQRAGSQQVILPIELHYERAVPQLVARKARSGGFVVHRNP